MAVADLTKSLEISYYPFHICATICMGESCFFCQHGKKGCWFGMWNLLIFKAVYMDPVKLAPLAFADPVRLTDTCNEMNIDEEAIF